MKVNFVCKICKRVCLVENSVLSVHLELTWAQFDSDVLKEEIEGSRGDFLMINNQNWNSDSEF